MFKLVAHKDSVIFQQRVNELIGKGYRSGPVFWDKESGFIMGMDKEADYVPLEKRDATDSDYQSTKKKKKFFN